LAVERGKYGTHIWDLSVAHTTSDDFTISSFLTNWVAILIWPFVKSSFFIMYLQLFKPYEWLRWATYIGLFITWGFYISVITATLYFTTPRPGQTWQESFRTPLYDKSFNMTIPIATGNLALDLYIFIIPIIPVLSFHLPFRKNSGVLVVFTTGLIACVASTLSMFVQTKLNKHEGDYTYFTLPVLLLSVAEMCVGISASCMPPCAPLFR
ncbi:hypothetical protein AOQ84DRAFT_254929, partial [Glonium stellatum]